MRRKNIGQNRVCIVIWESSENQFGRPNTSRKIFWKLFENPPLPLRKPRCSPVIEKVEQIVCTLRHHFRHDHQVHTLGEEHSDAVAHFLPRLVGHSEVEHAETVDEDRGHDHIHDEVGRLSAELEGEHETAELVVVCL